MNPLSKRLQRPKAGALMKPLSKSLHKAHGGYTNHPSKVLYECLSKGFAKSLHLSNKNVTQGMYSSSMRFEYPYHRVPLIALFNPLD